MDFLEVGKIINTHGLRGDVKINAWTDSDDVFENLKVVYLKKSNVYISITISSIKYQKNNLIVKFDEFNDINEVEQWKNSIIYAKRSDLGELPDGVHYIADLIGITVKKENGEILGTLTDVMQTGANDIYVVKRNERDDLLIPVIDSVVLSIDLTSREITVRLLEGLEDL